MAKKSKPEIIMSEVDDESVKTLDSVSEHTLLNILRDEINSFFVGKEDVVENVLICLLAGGHVLIEDVPGVGKTTLARTIAKAIDFSFGRIQFTPDTLPTDVTGLSIYNMKTNQFEYNEGAIMRQMVLADEINRTSPKTQASLLEAMAEGQVTVDGKMYILPDPFMVIATQNPVEFLGTYPLPEAQLDRFMMKLTIGYPTREEEIHMTKDFLQGKSVETVKQVCSTIDIIEMKKQVKQVEVGDRVLSYIQDIINKTRSEKSFVLGASPRAMLYLARASQAHAYLDGRKFVKPDDVKAVAVNTLHHRISLKTEAKIGNESIDNILANLVITATVPTE